MSNWEPQGILEGVRGPSGPTGAQGVKGDPGPSAVSRDTGNDLTLGGDGLPMFSHAQTLPGHVPHFATIADLNAAIPAPTNGQIAVVGTSYGWRVDGRPLYWNGKNWVPVTPPALGYFAYIDNWNIPAVGGAQTTVNPLRGPLPVTFPYATTMKVTVAAHFYAFNASTGNGVFSSKIVATAATPVTAGADSAPVIWTQHGMVVNHVATFSVAAGATPVFKHEMSQSAGATKVNAVTARMRMNMDIFVLPA